MEIKLKIHFIILISALLSRLTAQCQSSIEIIQSDLSIKLKKKFSDKSWSIENRSDEILVKFSETFFINASISPIYNRHGIYNKPDTITIRIKLENNWSQLKVDSIRQKNKMIIEPLKLKFITHYDSLNWRFVKLSRDIFIARPYGYLKNRSELDHNEKQAIRKIIILPDSVIGSVGIFVEPEYQPGAGMEIEPVEINTRILSAYRSFEEVLGKGALFKSEDRF